MKSERPSFSASSVHAAHPPRLFRGYLLPSRTMYPSTYLPSSFQQGGPVVCPGRKKAFTDLSLGPKSSASLSPFLLPVFLSLGVCVHVCVSVCLYYGME